METGSGKPETPKQKLARLRIQREELELQDLSMRVENETARRASIARAHEAQQRSLDDANEAIKAQQGDCKHKKGGMNLEGILNGSDSKYSVIKHMYPWGELSVMCSRCGRDWRRPPAELKQTNPEEFYRLEAEYKEAVNFPTDNNPSGTQLFIITRHAPPPAQMSA